MTESVTSQPAEAPTDATGRTDQPTAPGGLEPWMLVIQSASGGCKPRGFHKGELAAIALAISALEGDLEQPVLVADRLLLGSLARVVLMEHRAFRLAAERGIVTSGGEIRASLPEFRALAKLKAELLGRLRFKRTANVPTLDELRAQMVAASSAHHATNETASDPAPVSAVDRAAAGQDARDGNESGGITCPDCAGSGRASDPNLFGATVQCPRGCKQGAAQ